MTLVHQGRRLTSEEAKERRRLQTRLAQRRYRGKKRRDTASAQTEDAEKHESSRHVSLQRLDQEQVGEAMLSDVVYRALAGVEGRDSDVIQEYFDSTNFVKLVSAPASATDSSTSITSTSSGDSSVDSSPGTTSSPGISSSIIIAAAKDGYTGMVLAKHNKATLFDFLSGNLVEQINSHMLRQSESTFIPKLDFYRASFANAFALSFLPSDLGKCHMKSRITDVWNNRSPLLTVLDNMIPVQEQFTVDHDILVDILPWPSVRQKALRAIQAGVLDMNTFKRDAFFGCKEDANYQAAFQVHGASIDDDYYFNSTGAADLTMDPESWQCSQSWLEKYWFLVDAKIVRRTNWWRRMQGLPPIMISTLYDQQEQHSSRFAETLD